MPSQWRTGEIICSHKGGDPLCCSNYRPITLLPTIDKVFAAITFTRIRLTIDLHDAQYAYLPNKGTIQPLFLLNSLLQDRKQAGLPTYAFFLDIKKAFDTADHNAMLLKLNQHGVCGSLWNVVSDLYQKGHAHVRVNGCASESYHVQQGLAQGCPLSPRLYNIFMDDLLRSLHATGGPELVGLFLRAQAYADDLLCVAASQHDLQCLIDVCRQHSHDWL